MHDHGEAVCARWLELCARWEAAFPTLWWTYLPQREEGTVRERAFRVGRQLRELPWPVGHSPSLDAHDWAELRDTGRQDTVEHATVILAEEHGFEPVAEHILDSGRGSEPKLLRLFLRDGVLAQIEGRHWPPGGEVCTVDSITAWGWARITDWDAFTELERVSTGGVPAADQDLPRHLHRMQCEIGTYAGSFGLTWLPTTAAVDQWVTPWPAPAVTTWLGPREPSTTRHGYRTTQELLARIPDYVHDRLGAIATRS